MAEGHRARAGTRGIAFSRLRPLLAASTALTALAAVAPAHAQSPLATPVGGVVVAGQASVAQAPGRTTITQGSSRAAINWQSFNVGSQATVNFQQPSAQAVTLNRVMAPDPSTIAGHINANGSIVLINPNGVVFANGSEVNAAGLVVSAAGISNRNFMAGKMVFDQAGSPNARIVNKGTMTMGQAGLAALVAPQVVNSGVIDAKLGSVVLAGARTATLDLYGDGLVSLDVTSAVRSVPVGPDGKPATALVTNTGTIMAQGGTVELTAAAVDGLVQRLVDARGTVSADGIPGQSAGTVLVQGVGGSIQVAGALSASGEGSGGTGGAIGLDATGGVAVTKSAQIDASGPAGGGVVAVGTTLARTRGGPTVPAGLTAAHVRIAQGATIAADATDNGNGGRVTVLSTETTADYGAISARGGPRGGNGGFVEVSGHDLALDGAVDTTAPLGKTGTILLDPFDLQIVGPDQGDNDNIVTTSPVNGVAFDSGDATGTDTVSSNVIEALVGNVTLQAVDNIEFSANLALTGANQSLLVQAGNNILIDSGISVSATGNIEMEASSTAIPGNTTTGGITMNGVLSAGGNLTLSAGTGGIFFGDFSGNDGNVSANRTTGALSVSTTGAFEQFSGTITAATLSGNANFLFASNTGNAIGTLGAFTVPAGGEIFLNDGSDLTVAGPLSAVGGFLFILSTGNLTVAGPINAPSGNGFVSSVSLSANGNLILSGEVNATGGTVDVTSGGSITEPGGVILAGTLSGSSTGAALFTGDNAIDTVAAIISEEGTGISSADPPAPPAFIAGGNFTLVDSAPLTITAPITVPTGATIALVTDGLIEGSQTVFGPTGLETVFGALEAPGGEVSIAPFTPGVPVALVGAGPQPTGTLSLDDALLAAITAGTLALTSFGSEPITVSGANQLGNLTDPNTLLPSGVGTLLVKAGGAFNEAAGAVLNVGALTGSAASVALGGANVIATLDQFASNSGFELTDTTGLTVLGTVGDPTGITLDVASPGGITLGNGVTGEGSLSSNPTTGTVALTTSGFLDQFSGTITTGTLTGSAGFAFLDDANAIGTLGSFTVVTGGSFFLNDGVNLTVAGPVSAIGGFVSLTSTGNLLFSGEVNATGGTVALTSGGSITEPGGSILASTLNGTSAGAALFTGSNAVGTLASLSNSMPTDPPDAFVAGGNFTLVDSSALTLAAPVSVPAGDTIALVTNSLIEGSQTIFTETGSVTLFGALLAPGGEVSIEPFTASVPVALVGGGVQPAGTLSLGQALFDGITAGTLALTSFGGEPITVSGANLLGNLTDPNTGNASGVGTLLVAAGGAFTEAAGASLDVGVLTGSAASVALGRANVIPTLDQFSSTGGFELTDTTSLTVLGNVTDPTGIALVVSPGSLALGSGATAGTLSSAGTVKLQVPGGTITDPNGSVMAGTLTGTASNLAVFGFGSNISALGSFTVSGAGSELSLTSGVPLTITGPVTAGTFFVADPGAVTETGSGVLDVGVLTGNAGSVALGGANSVQTLEEFASAGSLSLTDITGLTVLGSVTAPAGITLLVNPGSLALGNASTFGSLTSVGTVNLQVPNGGITVPNGHLQAATLTGTASRLATFGTTNVATLGFFSVSGAAGEFALANNVPLTITGPVSAAFLDISAVGSLGLAGSLTTTGLPLAEQSGVTPALPGSVLTVLPNDAGAAQFQQVGTSVVTPFGGGTATLRVQLPAAGGTASFADLVAPGTSLVLALGSGRATGTMTVGQLLVIGAGGSANLFGSVRGITGPFAASLAAITPAVNINYLFNLCVIATTCANLNGVPPQGAPALVSEEGYPLIGYPLLGALFAQPEIILSIPLTLTEERNWADTAGFPLPNIARTDY